LKFDQERGSILVPSFRGNTTDLCKDFFISEEELAKEKEKLYEAIGYREDGQVPVYPKEVLCVSSQ